MSVEFVETTTFCLLVQVELVELVDKGPEFLGLSFVFVPIRVEPPDCLFLIGARREVLKFFSVCLSVECHFYFVLI